MSATTSPTFRADIEGLRAIAIISVALFHAGLPLSGGYIGVDVFFVISGFLITGLLLREYERTTTISLVNFYARRAKRLLPAALFLLAVCLVCTFVFAPSTRRGTFAGDVAYAAGYLANFRFAARSVDYLAEDVGPSPVLHFWSLSVEEQFYFIWPVVILLSILLERRLRVRSGRIASVALVLIFVSSLVWSIYFTEKSPAAAFFHTPTRLWELALGALFAVGTPRVSALRRVPREICAGCGAALVLISLFLFDADTLWPGYWAGVPCVGTALMLLSGEGSGSTFVGRLLSSRAMGLIGALSYSLYLWHWPVLVIGRDWLGLSGSAWSVSLVVFSFVPAWVSYRFVESPMRFSPRFRSPSGVIVRRGAAASLACALTGLGLSLYSEAQIYQSADSTLRLQIEPGRVIVTPESKGAGALSRLLFAEAVPNRLTVAVTPSPEAAENDLPSAYELGCQVRDSAPPKWCEFGDAKSSKRLVLLGDSKILQYSDALDAVGKALELRVQAVTKSGCPFSGAYHARKVRESEECHQFNEAVLKALLKEPPYAVITSQWTSRGRPVATPESQALTQEAMVDGLAAYWTRLQQRGVRVVALLDNPWPPKWKRPVYECVTQHPDQLLRCSFARGKAVLREGGEQVQRRAAEKVRNVGVIDMSDLLCPKGRCPPVIGDVLVYRQGTHISNTYARSLAPELAVRLRDELSRLK